MLKRKQNSFLFHGLAGTCAIVLVLSSEKTLTASASTYQMPTAEIGMDTLLYSSYGKEGNDTNQLNSEFVSVMDYWNQLEEGSNTIAEKIYEGLSGKNRDNISEEAEVREMILQQNIKKKSTVETLLIKESKEEKAVQTALSQSQRAGQVLSIQESIHLSNSERQALERIVHAEAGCEDMMGRILVANVVLNRYKSNKFPNTIVGVVTQKSGSTYQFSPVRPGGGYWTVSPSKETKEAVSRALAGEDYSQGALYFVARRYADKDNVSWFDRSLTKLFKHGNHEFYK